MNVEHVFISYGAASDKNSSAWEFYKYMNEEVKHKSGKYGYYKNIHRIGGDVIFNFQGNLNHLFKLNESTDKIILHCLSMCYTNLNKSIMQSKGRGRNLNVIKGGMIQKLDRGDLFISAVAGYYEPSSINIYKLEENINDSAKKFLDEFNNIVVFAHELYGIKRDYSCVELKKVIKTYFNNYKKSIRHVNGNFENSRINNYIKNDLEKSCEEIEQLLNHFISTKCKNTNFDLVRCLITRGQIPLEENNIEEYSIMAILFWAVRLDSIIRR